MLEVTIVSFSYKSPEQFRQAEYSVEHGGGYIFDCRCLPNPGRHAEYKTRTGQQDDVRDYLERETVVHEFYGAAERLVDCSVDNYLERKFGSLLVAFGCTGGQHRSVYMAERLARHLAERDGVTVRVVHREIERKKGIFT